MGALLNKTRTANEGAPNPTQSLSLLCFEIAQQNVQLEERHPNSNEYQFASERTFVCQDPHKWTTFWKEGKSMCLFMDGLWSRIPTFSIHLPSSLLVPLVAWRRKANNRKWSHIIIRHRWHRCDMGRKEGRQSKVVASPQKLSAICGSSLSTAGNAGDAAY